MADSLWKICVLLIAHVQCDLLLNLNNLVSDEADDVSFSPQAIKTPDTK